MIKKVSFRFYEELNDFLPPDKKKIRFEHKFIDRTSVKDMIESFGVPHTEIDMILVNGKSVNFDYLVRDTDDISVYPVFESIDISDIQHLRKSPLRHPLFIIDVQLGSLAKYLRMLGFDVLYKNNFSREEIIEKSINDSRTILTRDRELLKNNRITHGYWIRAEDAEHQIMEVILRFDLGKNIKEFVRCLECNNILEPIEKDKIVGRLPPKVKQQQNEFWYCGNCDKIYWKGTHYDKMLKLIERIKDAI